MTTAELQVFESCPDALGLYAFLREALLGHFPDAQVRAKKTQVAFWTKHGFAYVWLPIRKMKVRPKVYVLLSFGLDHAIDSPRIEQSAHPSKNRWTHHVVFSNPAQLDDELVGWLREAYEFSKR